MLARRLLVAGGSSSFILQPPAYPLVGLFNGQDGDGNYHIAATTSDDGITWTDPGSPLISAVAATQYDDHVKDPWLVHDGDDYHVFFSGYDGSNYRTFHRSAATIAGLASATTTLVLDLGSGGSFDDAGIIFPAALYEPWDVGREWKVWYTGFDGTRWHIGYAYGSSPTSLTKHGQVLTVGSSGQWDDEGLVLGCVFLEGSTYHLFYGGTSDPNGDFFWQTGYATFTDPEGTYTKAAANPVIGYVQAVDPDASQPLAANVASGTTTLRPADSSHYAPGQAIVLGDTSSETEVHRVVSIDNSTTITVEEQTTSAFTTADGARIRPLDYLSAQARTVRPVPGGYEAFVTAFQPIADLSFNAGVTKLREGSLRYTATSPDGPWTRDDDAGLLLPLYPEHTGWHQFSAENIAAIAP